MSLFDVFEDVGNWISDVASDVATGIDDAVCGVEEMFTGNRRERLEAAQRRIALIVKDVEDAQAIFGEATTTHAAVVEAIEHQAHAIGQTFAFDPETRGIDIGRIAGAGTTVALTGLALVELGGSLFAAMAPFAAVAGPVMIAAAIAAAALQTIFAGIAVADMRHEMARIDKAIGDLNALLPGLRDAFHKLVTALRATYEAVAEKNARGYFVTAIDGSEIYLDDYFAHLLEVATVIERQRDADREEMTRLRATIANECSTIRTAMLSAIHARMADAIALQAKAAAIAEALDEELSDTLIRRLLGVSDAMIAAVRRYRQAHPSNDLDDVRIQVANDGAIELVA